RGWPSRLDRARRGGSGNLHPPAPIPSQPDRLHAELGGVSHPIRSHVVVLHHAERCWNHHNQFARLNGDAWSNLPHVRGWGLADSVPLHGACRLGVGRARPKIPTPAAGNLALHPSGRSLSVLTLPTCLSRALSDRCDPGPHPAGWRWSRGAPAIT